ncbi:hypothetical protein [Aeromonas salmonicida]
MDSLTLSLEDSHLISTVNGQGMAPHEQGKPSGGRKHSQFGLKSASTIYAVPAPVATQDLSHPSTAQDSKGGILVGDRDAALNQLIQ